MLRVSLVLLLIFHNAQSRLDWWLARSLLLSGGELAVLLILLLSLELIRLGWWVLLSLLRSLLLSFVEDPVDTLDWLWELSELMWHHKLATLHQVGLFGPARIDHVQSCVYVWQNLRLYHSISIRLFLYPLLLVFNLITSEATNWFHLGNRSDLVDRKWSYLSSLGFDYWFLDQISCSFRVKITCRLNLRLMYQKFRLLNRGQLVHYICKICCLFKIRLTFIDQLRCTLRCIRLHDDSFWALPVDCNIFVDFRDRDTWCLGLRAMKFLR